MDETTDPGRGGRTKDPAVSLDAGRGRLDLVSALVALAWFGTVACGQVETVGSLTVSDSGPQGAIVATDLTSESSGPDQAPRVQLARRERDGTLSPIAGKFSSAVEFRDGMVAVTTDRELVVVHPDGSRSVLAHEVDGVPARVGDGSLVYAARFRQVVEIYHLTSEGENRRLASFRGSATRLAPQGDGTVVFVGSDVGGVSGVWIADGTGVRCLTNCDLRTGQPWGDRYVAPPGNTATIRVSGMQVDWQTPDGKWEHASLETDR